MTEAEQEAGGAATGSRTTGRRPSRGPHGLLTRALRDPLTRVVVATTVSGALASWAVLAGGPAPGGSGAVLLSGPVAGLPLWAGMAVLTCVAEIVAVRVRHSDGVEELTLLDPVVVVSVLFLPAREALAVTVVGLAAAYVVRRRHPVKAIFNIGTYATATVTMAVLAHAVAGGSPVGVGQRLVAAILVGVAGFVAVNLVAMSLLFSALGAGTVRSLLREDLRLTVFTLTTTLALSATVATIAVHTPAYLLFTVLPAAAITYAYRAIATEEEERRRNAHVLVFTQALAANPERDQAIAAFLRMARNGFAADEVRVGFPDEAELTVSGPGDAPARTVSGPGRAELLTRSGRGAALAGRDFAPGWSSGIIAPLEANGVVLGAVAVGRHSRPSFAAADLTVFSSLASALAAALASARHREELMAETAKLRTVLDQSSDGILVLDGAGRVELWNPAMERLTRCTEPEATGRELGGLLAAFALDGTAIDLFLLGRGQLSPHSPRAVVDTEIERPDGERRSVRCAHAGVFDEHGALVRDVVNMHDLTRERRVERLKSDFVATVSHELRTPITPLKGYAELLLRKGDDLPPEKRVRALNSIVDRAGHLARLVEDLLLAAHIDEDQEPTRAVTLDTVDLVELTSRAMEDFGDSAARLHLAVPGTPVTATADGARTVQILTNLISNALKYSDPGTPIDLAVRAGKDGGRISVRDHGRGLPEDECERIFEKFHRVEDPMVMSTSGTGLGLYIARHLARAMHGDLTVASWLGEGSTFTLRLPAPRPERDPEDGTPRGASAG